MKTIKNVAIVGDPHLNSSTPASRVDDFAITSIEKLDSLLKICKVKDISTVVFLGDMFHKPQQPIGYLYRVINALNQFRLNNIDLYSIVGNSHDVPYDKVSYLPRTSLGLLFTTGVVKQLEYEKFITKEGYDVSFFGYPYEVPIKSTVERESELSKINVCVAHRFYNYAYSSSSLSKAKIKELGYSIYCLGHEHQPHDLENLDGQLIVRPGRFMRGTSDKYNIEDTSVYIDVIRFNGSKEEPRVTIVREIVPTKTASEVFNIKSLTKDNSEKSLSNLSQRVDELLSKMDINDYSQSSVYTVLDSLDVDIRIKDRIETYLQSQGIYRNTILV